MISLSKAGFDMNYVKRGSELKCFVCESSSTQFFLCAIHVPITAFVDLWPSEGIPHLFREIMNPFSRPLVFGIILWLDGCPQDVFQATSQSEDERTHATLGQGLMNVLPICECRHRSVAVFDLIS